MVYLSNVNDFVLRSKVKFIVLFGYEVLFILSICSFFCVIWGFFIFGLRGEVVFGLLYRAYIMVYSYLFTSGKAYNLLLLRSLGLMVFIFVSLILGLRVLRGIVFLFLFIFLNFVVDSKRFLGVFSYIFMILGVLIPLLIMGSIVGGALLSLFVRVGNCAEEVSPLISKIPFYPF